MTEKVLNAGIEDVLSSIKRLVSEEDRKVPGLMGSSMSCKPGRLVLTDALRVSDSADETKPEQQKSAYKAEDSVKPMLLRACDIVKHAEPAPEQQTKTEVDGALVDSLSFKIEALEAAIARTEDQWEPDGDSDDAYSGTPTKSLNWNAEDEFVEAQNAKAAITEAKQPKSSTTATFIRDRESSAAAPVQVSEAVEPQISLSMDEDALRALIAEVVREELQGVLGERITRNVRKMVRREIYRALAEQKAD